MQGVSLITFIAIIYFSFCALLGCFLLSVKSKNKISNQLFAVFLFLIAIDISAYFHNLFLDGFGNLVLAKSLFAYLQMPVLYFYVLSVCFSNFRLRRTHLLHLLPFFIGNLILYPRFYSRDKNYINSLWENFNSIWELIFIHFSVHLQFIIYFILIFLILKRYQKIYQQNFSNTASKTHKWLFQFTLILVILHIFVIVKSILKYVDNESSFPVAQMIVSVGGLLVVIWLVLKALRQPDLFQSVNSTTDIIEKKQEARTTQRATKEIELLRAFMQAEEPYLDASLSLKDLANRMQWSPRELSILINQNLQQHFFGFVNQYRIEKAMSLLKDPSKSKHTVLYEVGFNSKSSFNTAFKKHTGLTPTNFRKST